MRREITLGLHRDLAADTLVYANACGAKVHALGCDQPPRLYALFYELAH